MNAGNLPTTTIYAIYPSMVIPYTITSTRFALPPPPPVLPLIYIPSGQTQPSQNPAPQFFVEQATVPFGQYFQMSPVLYFPAQVVPHHPAPIVQHPPAQVVPHHPTPIVQHPPAQVVPYHPTPIVQHPPAPVAQQLPVPELPVPDHHDTEDSMQVDQTDSSEHKSIQETSNEPPSIPQDVSAATTSSSEPPEAPETQNTTKHDSGPSSTDKWICDRCSSKLPSRTELYKHRQDAHGDRGLSSEYDQGPSQRFNNQNRTHQLTYSRKPSFPCKLCRKTGTRRELLDVHLRQYHRVEIPYNDTYRSLLN